MKADSKAYVTAYKIKHQSPLMKWHTWITIHEFWFIKSCMDWFSFNFSYNNRWVLHMVKKTKMVAVEEKRIHEKGEKYLEL